MMTILQFDETETGPRIRKTLTDKGGIDCKLESSGIGGVMTKDGTVVDLDLYSYVRPSNGQTLWIIEARIFFLPDIELFRSWVVSERPNDEQIRDIVASNAQPEAAK